MKSKNIVRFFQEVGKLKTLKRSGWIINGIRNPESVADHSFRTAIMAYLFAKKLKINREKAVAMALVHDLAESQTGDIATKPGKSLGKGRYTPRNKLRKESDAYKRLSSILGDREFYNLWLEFEKGKSKEAKLVRQLDKLETRLQAMEYEKSQRKDLGEFFCLAGEEIKDKKLKEILKEIMMMRKTHP